MEQTPITKDVLENLYIDQKMSAYKIAKKFELKPYQVYYLLEKFEISRRSLTEMNTAFSVNHGYFSQIDTPEKAYWLGFLYADGFLTNRNQIGLSLAKVDATHIEKFKNAIESNHNIHFYQTKGYGNGIYAKLIFSSEKMSSDLQRLGCIQHKSLILKFPNENQVSKQFIRDFVRGYFDGDGSITTGGAWHPIRLKICGTKEFLSSLINYFNEIIYPDFVSPTLEKRKRDDKNTYAVTIGSVNRVLTILDELYMNSSIYLDRKYVLYVKKKKCASTVEPIRNGGCLTL